jgi:hypothetical protein
MRWSWQNGPKSEQTQKRPFEAVRRLPAFCRSFISRWRITQGNVDGLSVPYWEDYGSAAFDCSGGVSGRLFMSKGGRQPTRMLVSNVRRLPILFKTF